MRDSKRRAARFSQVMQAEIVAVLPDTTVGELVQILAREGISGVPVVEEDGTVRGVVSATDVIRHAAQAREVSVGGLRWDAASVQADGGEGEGLDGFYLDSDTRIALAYPFMAALDAVGTYEATVSEIMTPVAFSVRSEDGISEAAELLLRGRIHRLLVLRDGRLVGIVTPLDLLRAVFSEA